MLAVIFEAVEAIATAIPLPFAPNHLESSSTTTSAQQSTLRSSELTYRNAMVVMDSSNGSGVCHPHGLLSSPRPSDQQPTKNLLSILYFCRRFPGFSKFQNSRKPQTTEKSLDYTDSVKLLQ